MELSQGSNWRTEVFIDAMRRAEARHRAAEDLKPKTVSITGSATTGLATTGLAENHERGRYRDIEQRITSGNEEKGWENEAENRANQKEATEAIGVHSLLQARPLMKVTVECNQQDKTQPTQNVQVKTRMILRTRLKAIPTIGYSPQAAVSTYGPVKPQPKPPPDVAESDHKCNSRNFYMSSELNDALRHIRMTIVH